MHSKFVIGIAFIPLFVLVPLGPLVQQDAVLQNSLGNELSTMNNLGNKISVIHQHAPIVITSDSNFSALGFPGSGTAEDPYRIENFTISANDTCIEISSTTSYFIIRNCIIMGSNKSDGIALSNVTHAFVINNTISSKRSGMVLESTTDCLLMNNSINANLVDGVIMNKCDGINITGNVISQNKNYGIYVMGGSSNLNLTWNFVYSNSLFGAMIDYGNAGLLVVSNIFANNSALDAWDNGDNNQWNLSAIGNFWADYKGETTRNIAGDAHSVDYHPRLIPLAYDIFPPELRQKTDWLGVNRDSPSAKIIWSVQEAYPDRYILLRNGELMANESWDGSPIVIHIENLTTTPTNITLVAFDQAGNHARGTLMAFVIDQVAPSATTTPTTTTSTTGEYPASTPQEPVVIIVSGALIAIIVVAELRARRK